MEIPYECAVSSRNELFLVWCCGIVPLLDVQWLVLTLVLHQLFPYSFLDFFSADLTASAWPGGERLDRSTIALSMVQPVCSLSAHSSLFLTA